MRIAPVAVAAAIIIPSLTSQPRAPHLTPAIPAGITGTPSQRAYDTLGWQLFVALNWPAKNGEADRSVTIGQAAGAPRVWDFFTDPIDIFKSSSLCPDDKPSAQNKVLRMARDNTGSTNGLDIQAGSSWPLVDQRGNFAMVEVVVNGAHRQYIESNGLTTMQGIAQFAKQQRTFRFPTGAMELKAAWRLFPADTDPRILARYYTRQAIVCVAKEQSRTGQALRIEGTVGLVGLHIVYKTKDQPRWIWSTFEQVDNYEVAYKPLPGLTPTFSPGVAPADPNRQPQPPPAAGQLYQWSATQPTAGSATPTQAARCANEPALPSALNAAWQSALAAVPDSPWQYYRLNATQWFDATDRLHPRNADGVPVSRNSTLETYLLGDQTIAAQVPTIGPVVSRPTIDPPNSTLADTIVATIVAASTPKKTGAYTWSNCVVCHQMAMYQFGPDPASRSDSILTDDSFIFRSNIRPGDKK